MVSRNKWTWFPTEKGHAGLRNIIRIVETMAQTIVSRGYIEQLGRRAKAPVIGCGKQKMSRAVLVLTYLWLLAVVQEASEGEYLSTRQFLSNDKKQPAFVANYVTYPAV